MRQNSKKHVSYCNFRHYLLYLLKNSIKKSLLLTKFATIGPKIRTLWKVFYTHKPKYILYKQEISKYYLKSNYWH